METPPARARIDGRRLGLRIRRLRAALGITQEALAWDSGHAKSYLCEIESGRKLPSLEVLADIAARLGVEPYDLLVDPEDDARARLVDASRSAPPDALARALQALTPT